MSAKRQQLFEDSLAGSALALFAGDALGASIQGLRMIPLRQHLGWVNEMLNGRYAPGTYTDDTQIMIGVLEALDEDETLAPSLLANILAHNHEEERGYGASTGEVLGALHRHEIGVDELCRESYGNGGATGVAPVGVYFSADLARVVESASRVCTTTHRHPEAVGGAIAVAAAAAMLTRARLDGERLAFKPMLERLMGLEAVQATPMGRALSRLDDLPLRSPGHMRSAYLADTFDCTLRAVESVPIAIGAALSSASLREAVEVAVNTGGDTDTQGAIAGGIAGAYYGAEALPESWRDQLENGFKGRDYVRALVHRLAGRARID